MRILLLIALSTFLLSCNLDRVTTEYTTFEQADKDNFFEKGWIPIELVNEEITDIYLQNDIDINTFIFSFRTSEMPISFDNETDLQNESIELHRIDIPDWWNSEIIGQPRTNIQTENGLVNIVVNERLNKVYGWGKYGR